MMGLAPYGESKYAPTILDNLIDLKEDGCFRLNLDYFDYCAGLKMTNGRFDALFGGPARSPREPLMNEMAAVRGIPVIDQFDYILGQGGRGEYAQFAHDSHWNAAGHQWAAEALLEYLKQNPEICDAPAVSSEL